MFSEQLLGLSL